MQMVPYDICKWEILCLCTVFSPHIIRSIGPQMLKLKFLQSNENDILVHFNFGVHVVPCLQIVKKA